MWLCCTGVGTQQASAGYLDRRHGYFLAEADGAMLLLLLHGGLSLVNIPTHTCTTTMAGRVAGLLSAVRLTGGRKK